MALTRIQSIGIATGISLTGVTTTKDAKIGTGITLSPDGDGYYTGVVTATTYYGDASNMTGVGPTDFIDAETLNVSGISTLNSTKVGSGITLSVDVDGYFTGVVTATSYYGSGANLTGIDATQIVTGNTSVQTVDTGSDGHVKVTTEGTERVRVNNTGSVIVGDTAGQIGKLSVISAGGNISAIRHSTDTSAPDISLNKYRGSRSSPTTVANGDYLGKISFTGYDGTSNEKGAEIAALTNGTVDGSNMTTDLLFYTTTANTLTERARIKAAGDLILGATGNSNTTLDRSLCIGSSAYARPGVVIRGNSTNKGDISFCDNSGAEGDDGVSEGLVRYDHDGDYMCFHTADAERVRITSAGNLVVGTTASNNLIHAQGSSGTPTISVKNTGGACNLYAEASSGNTAKLDLTQAGTSSYSLRNGSADALQFYRDSTEIARFDSGGRFAVGTNSPSSYYAAKLVVDIGTAAQSGITIVSDTDKDGMLAFADGTSGNERYRGSINYDHNIDALQLSSAGDTRLTINNDHNVIIGENMNLESNDANLHVNTKTDGGQGGIYVHCNGQGGGTAAPHYGLKIDALNCANNANLQAGIIIDVNQQYTQSGTGVQSEVNGNYSNQKCFEAHLNKSLGAYTDGYCYHSNIVTTSSGGTAFHAYFKDNGTLKFRIYQNGNAQNANNSWGSTSDVKLKENIVDAGSQWADIKAVKVRNFNFKASTGQDTSKHIGVIAQEIETVSPGLVHTDSDTTTDEATGEGTVTGTTKSVKYSILYMKAIKALQEAMTRIETLEAKVATLESS